MSIEGLSLAPMDSVAVCGAIAVVLLTVLALFSKQIKALFQVSKHDPAPDVSTVRKMLQVDTPKRLD